MATSTRRPPIASNSSDGKRVVSVARRFFKGIRDPRARRGKRHRLTDVVLMSLMAMLCTCDNAEDIAAWTDLHKDWLQLWFDLKHGTPSQDTILRVFEALRPRALADAVKSWLSSLRPAVAGHIAIDGKTLRGSRGAAKGKTAVHLVSAWLRDAGLVLGQVKTEDKSNETTAIPELLRLLDVEGSVVSIDAAGCYRAIAKQIVEQKGHYFLAVKDNQLTLKQDIERLFAEGNESRRRSVDELPRPVTTQARDTDGGHGRIEERSATVSSDLGWLTTREEWKNLSAVVMIEASRTSTTTGEVETERRYYITSEATLSAERALDLSRGHWSVENQLHWVLDVEFREDHSRIRSRRAAENFGLLRRMALSMLKAAPTPKPRMSITQRRRYCDHRLDYLCSVLTASPV